MKRSIRSVFLLCLSLTLLTGCASRMKSHPAVIPSDVSSQEILSRIASKFPPDDVLLTKGRFTVESPRGRFSTGLVLFAGRPSLLRIEALSLLGLPDLIITGNDQHLKINAIREGKFYIGSADQDFSCFLPIYLNARDSVAFILGLPPGVQGAHDTFRGYLLEKDLYRIDLFSGVDKMQTLWVDPIRCILTKVEKYDQGEVLYQADLDDYRQVGDHLLPGRIRIRFDRPEQLTMTLRFSSGSIRKSGEVEFDIEAPAGVQPIYLK